MDVQSISGVSGTQHGTNVGAAGTASSSLDYNSFLKLLLAEMKNQDPMEPMKGSEYVAQLATFSQVEKSVQMNDRIASVMASSQWTQAEGLIGRMVTSADGSLSGIASAAKVTSDGVSAVLDNGTEILMTQGVKVS